MVVPLTIKAIRKGSDDAAPVKTVVARMYAIIARQRKLWRWQRSRASDELDYDVEIHGVVLRETHDHIFERVGRSHLPMARITAISMCLKVPACCGSGISRMMRLLTSSEKCW